MILVGVGLLCQVPLAADTCRPPASSYYPYLRYNAPQLKGASSRFEGAALADMCHSSAYTCHPPASSYLLLSSYTAPQPVAPPRIFDWGGGILVRQTHLHQIPISLRILVTLF